MKYKVIKSFWNFTCDWSTITNPVNGSIEVCQKEVPVEFLIDYGFIEEVKETPKPRWNVGDYVVNKDPLVYRKISTIFFVNTQYFVYDLYKEEELRDPTPEELSTYFR